VLSARLPPGPGEGPTVSIVVLTHNGREHLERLLAALDDDTSYRSFELIVVDNASTDRTDEVLARERGYPVKVITNPVNESFSTGCNQGAEVAAGEHLLLLNNDVTPVNPGWLGNMVEAIESDATIGAVGAVLAHPPEPNGRVAVHHRGIGFRLVDGAPRPANLPAPDVGSTDLDALTPVPAATAACLLTPAAAYREMGGLDEGYHYGMEDVDYCLRLGAAGRTIHVCGTARLLHHESATLGTIDRDEWRRTRLANRRRFTGRWGVTLARSMADEAFTGAGFWVAGRRRRAAVIARPATAGAAHVGWLSAHGWTVGDPDEGTSLVLVLDPAADLAPVPAEAAVVAVLDTPDGWEGLAPRISVAVRPDRIDPGSVAAAGMTPSEPADTEDPGEVLRLARDGLQSRRVAIVAPDESGDSRALATALRTRGWLVRTVGPERLEHGLAADAVVEPDRAPATNEMSPEARIDRLVNHLVATFDGQTPAAEP
jgi:GT2 family glycosyltransferase